jgi:hypothetical protein
MDNRFSRFLLVGIFMLLAFLAVQPFVLEQLNSATTPRPIVPRGDLAEYERTAIDIFDHVSPSVVQVAGAAGNAATTPSGGGGSKRRGKRPERHGLHLGCRRSHRDQ